MLLTHALRAARLKTALTYVTSPATASGTVNTLTFSGVSIGSADTYRRVVICVGSYTNAASANFTSLTFNGTAVSGVAATLTASNGGTNIYIVSAPSGTTANIVLNWSTTVARNAKISVYRLIHPSGIPFSSTYVSGALNVSATVNTQFSGRALFMGMTNSGSGGAAGTPTNYVEDVEVDINSNEWFTSGICNAALGGNVSMSNTGQAQVFAASWS